MFNFSNSISQNVKLGLQYRYQQGEIQINCSRFLGYTKNEKKKLIIVPEEAEVVKRIYREYLEGASMLKICTMKITWNFADGTTSEVEVNEELGTFITASRREEDNLSRKERYHCYSLDAILFEGKEYGDNHTPETEMEIAERNKQLYNAMKTLTAVQQRRLLMLADGLSMREIARLESVDHRAIRESIEAARKKFKKNF